MRNGDARLGRPAGLSAAFASIGVLSGVGLAHVLQRPLGDDRAGGQRRVEEAALRPDQARLRPVEGPPPAVARRGTTDVPISATLYPGERETQVGLVATLSVHNTSPDRESVVYRVADDDTADKLVRRVADGPHVVPTMAPAESFLARDDPTGGPGADNFVGGDVLDGGSERPIEAVRVGRSGPTNLCRVGRGVVLDVEVTAPAAPGAGR